MNFFSILFGIVFTNEQFCSKKTAFSTGETTRQSQGAVLAIVISCSVALILLVLIVAFFYRRKMLRKYGPYLQTDLLFEVI